MADEEDGIAGVQVIFFRFKTLACRAVAQGESLRKGARRGGILISEADGRGKWTGGRLAAASMRADKAGAAPLFRRAFDRLT